MSLSITDFQKISKRLASLLSAYSILLCAVSVFAEGGYTNHAGNVVAGWPVKLTQKEVALAERVVANDCQLSTNDYRLTTTYPLSIFPESEQRRIAADFGQPRVPAAVKRAITGAEKAMARSRKGCAQELPRQAGKGRRAHPGGTKGARALIPPAFMRHSRHK